MVCELYLSTAKTRINLTKRAWRHDWRPLGLAWPGWTELCLLHLGVVVVEFIKGIPVKDRVLWHSRPARLLHIDLALQSLGQVDDKQLQQGNA